MFTYGVSKATPYNAIKEKNGEQPTRKQLEALLNMFARQQQIKPSDRVCQRASNDHIMTCLGMKSPNQVLAQYQGVMW